MKPEPKIYFTSDIHFGHQNVIEFCNRPWKTADEMNEAIVDRWNEVVTKRDRVYILGDVAMKIKLAEVVKLLKRLKGQLFLVRGNHDSEYMKKPEFLECFSWVRDLYGLKVKDPSVERGRTYAVLCHYPILQWNRKTHGSWMLHGHCHNGSSHPVMNDGTLRLDVGMDAHDYRPISYEQVRALMEAP